MMKHPIEKARRQYNNWVATETLEDYSLRYSPASFRKWSPLLLANTALGSISFLALETIGAVLLFNFGYVNALSAIALAALIILLAGIPISYHAARNNIDIDLLTRSAGFGYVGSTVTSLVYASFCFIFFALEASIMAQALKLYFELPLYLGYILCSLIVLPIGYHGITAINRLHQWTQPLWLALMIIPFYFVLTREPKAIEFLTHYTGNLSGSNEFDPYYFGIATGISFALIAQIGEQVDYLRFMPTKTNENRISWWFALMAAGPGWIVLGFVKQLGGMLLASVAVLSGLAIVEAKEPVQMYYIAYSYVFEHPEIALIVSTVFVVISQIKINATNAYAGSLAWSNFFSRVTYSHPGRVVWLIFNIGIALLLMELGVFEFLQKVLGLYSNVAIAWISAIVSDLTINHYLKLRPPQVEFKRAHLYDFNPVGFVSMSVASLVSIIAFTGVFGLYAQAYSWLIALVISFVLVPLIAKITGGKYYIARENEHFPNSDELQTCGVCERHYAQTDFAYCSFHETPICSLCCTLDSSCKDQCKPPQMSFYRQGVLKLLTALFDNRISKQTSARIVSFSGFTGLMLGAVTITFWLMYSIESETLNVVNADELRTILYNLFFAFAVLICIAAWWIILVQESQALAETELNEQNEQLAQEITERELTEKALKISEHRFKTMFNEAPLGIALIDSLTGKIYAVNAKYAKIVHRSINELIALDWMSITHPDDVQGDLDNMARLNAGEIAGFQMEKRYLFPDGTPVWINMTIAPICVEDKTQPRHLAMIEDITERKDAENKIKQLAFYDPLTQLPNRRLFQDRLTHAINAARRECTQFALLMLDLDYFKAVNDNFGHLAGDELLQQVATRILARLRHTDTVARLGGDEFVVLLEDIAHPDDAARVAEEIVAELQKPFCLSQSDNVQIGASIGISLYPEHGDSPEVLMDHADTALYQAKDAGRGCFAYFSEDLTLAARERIALETRLRQAIELQELRVFFQPQVDILSGRIVGAEALVRWQDPIDGLIQPQQFIPMAEETGLIVDIGVWVLRETCRQGREWLDAGLPPLTLAVNVSPHQFCRSDICALVTTTLEDTGFPADQLELEITESGLMGNQIHAASILNALRNQGIRLAIDDFGTGYSSLASLKHFPLDVLKIDKSFIDNISFQQDDMEIAATIIAMGHILGFKVLAEGVETVEQLTFLHERGCDLYQGYIKSQPIPAHEFAELLRGSIL